MLIAFGILCLVGLLVKCWLRFVINFVGLGLWFMKIFLGLLFVALPLLTLWAWFACLI